MCAAYMCRYAIAEWREPAHSGDDPRQYLVEHHIFIQTEDDIVKKFDMDCSGWLEIGAADQQGEAT